MKAISEFSTAGVASEWLRFRVACYHETLLCQRLRSSGVDSEMSSNRPILFISTNDGAPWGGSEELWFEVALKLAGAGLPVVASVLKWPNRSPKLAELEAGKVAVIEQGTPAIPARLLLKAFPGRKYDWLRRVNPRFAFLSQGTNFDKMTFEIGEVLIALGIPYAIVSQSAHPWYWPEDDSAARMRTVFQGAKASYFVSEANLQLTRLQVGDPLRNGSVLRNPFNVDYDQVLPYPADREFRLACVGRLDPGVKGQDLLIEALSRGDWKHRPLLVTLYGGGKNVEIVRRLQAAFDVPNVRFGGFASPRDIWRESHALVLASRAEGLPIVVVEAMLCGRICIVTDVGGNSEVIEDGVDGFIARDVSAAGIGNALERAWERRAEWQSMGERAAESIRRKVTRDPSGWLAEELRKRIDN